MSTTSPPEEVGSARKRARNRARKRAIASARALFRSQDDDDDDGDGGRSSWGCAILRDKPSAHGITFFRTLSGSW
jgi:hypothetical protein